jgi:protein TonB
MKQILIASIIAIGLHIAFFAFLPLLLQKNHKPVQAEIKSVIITMSYRTLELRKKKHEKKPFIEIAKKNKTDKPKKKINQNRSEAIRIKKIKPAPELKAGTKALQRIDLNSLPKTNIKQQVDDYQADDTVNSNLQNKKTVNNNENFVKIIEPVYKKKPLLKYPIKAKRRGYEGIVELMVQVSIKGSVSNLWIFKSSNYKSLDNQAVKIVRKWIFEPGKKDGKPEKMWVKIPVKFQLK